MPLAIIYDKARRVFSHAHICTVALNQFTDERQDFSNRYRPCLTCVRKTRYIISRNKICSTKTFYANVLLEYKFNFSV